MHKLQQRSVDGRHNGSDFIVEAAEGVGGEINISEVSVDGVVISSDHLDSEAGMNAALGSGANLARQHIDAFDNEPVEAVQLVDGDPF